MKWRYDGAADALYLQVKAGVPTAQEEVSDSIVVDVDAEGDLLGVEVLDAGLGWEPSQILSRFALDPLVREMLERLSHTMLPRSPDVLPPMQSEQDPDLIGARLAEAHDRY